MSMLENLDFIKINGLQDFLQYQNKKYKCDKCGYLKNSSSKILSTLFQ